MTSSRVFAPPTIRAPGSTRSIAVHRLRTVGIDMEDADATLEDNGVASFHASSPEVLAAVEAKPPRLARH
jgi:hypothetical protein